MDEDKKSNQIENKYEIYEFREEKGMQLYDVFLLMALSLLILCFFAIVFKCIHHYGGT